MRRTLSRLTVKAVQSLAKKPGMHCDGGGLYLQVTRDAVASWTFRFRPAGAKAERYMGLGPLHTVTLAEARQKALEQRKLLLDDLDPIEVRRARRATIRLAAAKAVTFAECAEKFIAAHQAGWRNPKHAAQWPATLAAYAYPTFGDLPVQAVDVGLIMKAVEPIWTAKPETASRVRGRIESVLDWATARGYRQGENPARWKGHLENLLPARSKVATVEHHAAVPYPEIADFMVELRQQQGVAARALEFLILTASRTGEVTDATWAEVDDLEARLWTIPGSRMKAGREHRVPLSGDATTILRAMAAVRTGQYLFPGNRGDRPLSNMAMSMLLRRMGRTETVHGFRSAFSDWCAEQTNFPAEVREMALAHAVGDKVEAAYRRGDLLKKRYQLAEAWARFCAMPSAAGEVVPICGRSR